jgi:hypothetical protein
MGGLSQDQAIERLTPRASQGPEAYAATNLSVNPYLSPYMGMFSGSGDEARPLFAMPALSSPQQQWIARMATGAFNSTNMGNLPLALGTRHQAGPPSGPGGDTFKPPESGLVLGPNGIPGNFEPGINNVPVFVPVGSYLNPTTMIVQPFGPGAPTDVGGGSL